MAALDTFTVIYLGRSQTHWENLRQAAHRLKGLQEQRQNGATPGDFIQMQIAATQRDALSMVRQEIPDLLFIETDINQASRIRFCQQIRRLAPDALIVTTGAHRPRKRSAYNHFLRMPFTTDQAADLLATLLREHDYPILKVGAITLHRTRRIVESPAGQKRLTPKMTALLALLMSRGERVTSRSMLMREVWNVQNPTDTRTLDVHIRWLREIIEPDPSDPALIVTVRGEGYRFGG